jgi:hypothetical protein
MLQAERSRLLFEMRSQDISVDFHPYYGPGVDSILNTNEYQEAS